MKRLPQPRERIYDLYWYFAAERQAIFERRLTGLPQPWSQNPIFQEYKFCNVFRAADRVSQYMIRNVACNPDYDNSADQLFQIVAFRTFSKIKTWESLKTTLGHYPLIQNLSDGSLEKALGEIKKTKRRFVHRCIYFMR